MTANEFVRGLLTYLNRLKAGGQNVVPMDGVINNLVVLQTSLEHADPAITPAKLVEMQATFDLEHYRAQIEGSHRLFESVISTAAAAIRALFLVNGGGCVALLALVGSLAASSNGGNDAATMLAAPLLAFAAGVGLAAFATCTFSFAQGLFHINRPRWAETFSWITRILAIASLGAFSFGCYLGYQRLIDIQAGNHRSVLALQIMG